MQKPKIVRLVVKIMLGVVVAALLVITAASFIAYNKKDQLLDKALSTLNETLTGRVAVKDVAFSPFENFPYVSIDLQGIEIHETKSMDSDTILFVQDAYLGFDLWQILRGNYTIKKIKLSNGVARLVADEDGRLNVQSAFSTQQDPGESAANDPLQLELSALVLENIDLIKQNRSNGLLVDAFIEQAQASFVSDKQQLKATLETDMIFNMLLEKDTTFLHDKHISLETSITYNLSEDLLEVAPSNLIIEKAQFQMEGTIDVADDMNLDLKFSGRKPNFDLFLAFAPPEIAPILNRYDNGGQVFFDAVVQGRSINGSNPNISIDFGCAEAFIENTAVNASINDLYFKGNFNNGAANSAATSNLTISEFRARPETGNFEASISVDNFYSPEFDVQLQSSLDLQFLADFIGLDQLENLTGKVSLKMNFHDIIDLDDPYKAVERLNESYFTELKIENVNFTSPDFHVPIREFNLEAYMDGHKAIVPNLSLKMGESDVALSASISDLPAIIHHTDIPVDVDLKISSELLNLTEMTQASGDSIGFNEVIKGLILDLQFVSSARAITESPNLPLGEFFIENLNAKLVNYAHELHDFRADLFVDSSDFRLVDFSGMIDSSDFHFDGKLANYDLWFEEEPVGETQVDFNLTGNLIRLKDFLAYGVKEYLPEDYQKESIERLKIHGVSSITFDKRLAAVSVDMDRIEAYLQYHKIFFEDFAGKMYLDSTLFTFEELGGTVGNSSFELDLTHYRKNREGKRDQFNLRSPRLDFDQLFSYIPPESDTTTVNHAEAFNVFDIPFPNLDASIAIEDLNYHRYKITDFNFTGRVQDDHYLYVDSMRLNAAGGSMQLKGYFNGSDPDNIYFSPDMEMQDVDLDQLLFKFDNFGQDALVSDNLKGRLTGKVTGQIKMHPDLIPIIETSNLDINVSVVNGALKNFAAFEAMSDYFADKNLAYVRFDTLRNDFQLRNGELIIPAMTLNTSLGYFEISGTQNVDLNMDYAIRIPWKVIASAAKQKLFGKKDQDNSDQIDAIQYRDTTRRTRFLNVRVTGTPEDFDVSLGKK